MLQDIITLAHRAGEAVIAVYRKDFQVYEKVDESPVTDADLKANTIILEGLEKYGYPVISEETKDSEERLKSDKVWIVDPIDGTKDFIDQTGEFCILIGLAEKGRSILGVAYQPTTKKTYFAEKGKGAFVQIADEKPIKLNVTETKDETKANALTSRHHLSERVVQILEKLNVVSYERCGSNGLKIAKIAEGAADLYFTQTDKMGEWDNCATDIILREAGGMVTDIQGKDLQYNKKVPNNLYGVIASNGFLHPLIQSQLQE
jgi:3'(2'), 5'-bisphosphate nucleotidase